VLMKFLDFPRTCSSYFVATLLLLQLASFVIALQFVTRVEPICQLGCPCVFGLICKFSSSDFGSWNLSFELGTSYRIVQVQLVWTST